MNEGIHALARRDFKGLIGLSCIRVIDQHRLLEGGSSERLDVLRDPGGDVAEGVQSVELGVRAVLRGGGVASLA